MVTGAFSKICLDGAVGVEKRQKKIRDVTLLTKVHLVKAMVFPVIMYGYESWTITKAECSNQSILKEISPECSLKGLMLKLKSDTLAT